MCPVEHLNVYYIYKRPWKLSLFNWEIHNWDWVVKQSNVLTWVSGNSSEKLWEPFSYFTHFAFRVMNYRWLKPPYFQCVTLKMQTSLSKLPNWGWRESSIGKALALASTRIWIRSLDPTLKNKQTNKSGDWRDGSPSQRAAPRLMASVQTPEPTWGTEHWLPRVVLWPACLCCGTHSKYFDF